MKTKHTPKLIVLILSVMMIVSMFCVMTVSASAAETSETPAASITGKSVNLGGDISMKYYVTLNDTTIDKVDLKITFLGVETTLEATEDDKVGDEYVFTFTGIPPQCMGDTIYADVLVDNEKVGETVTYSVKDSLEYVYNRTGATATEKQLVADTLKYGAAMQEYAGYKTDALVTNGLNYAEFNNSKEIPENYPTGTTTDETATVFGNVHFSYINFLKFKFSSAPVEDVTGDVTLESENVYRTTGIAPYDFDADYNVKTGTIDFNYSINDYCYAVSQSENASENMKDLAKALYNYGRSAEALKHAENSEHTNVTYVVEGATIHATCPACGDIGSITLMNPESLVYDGTDKVVTCTGEIQYLENPVVNYEGDRKNVTDDGFTAYIEIDGVKAELNVKLERADATVANAPTANDLTYTGSAQELVSAGSATGGNLVYSLSLTGEYTGTIPTGTYARDYTVWYKVVAGNNNYKDSEVASVNVNIGTASIADATAASIADQQYTGSAITPEVKLSFGGKDLVLNTDYTVAYSNNTNEGTATVTVTGQGNFTGTKTLSFNIIKHIHAWTDYSVSDNVITVKCTGTVGTCPNDTATATVTAVPSIDYTGSAITPAEVIYSDNWEGGKLDITYANNTNAGTATASISVDGKTASTSFTITPKTLTAPRFDGIMAEYTYTGNAIEPTFTLKNGEIVIDPSEYTVTYSENRTNVGEVTVTITDKDGGNYTVSGTTTFQIVAKDASSATVTVSGIYVYSGEAITPDAANVTVTLDGKTLVYGEDKDYTFAATNNDAAGTATLTVTFRGNYEGTATASFEISDHAHVWTYSASGDTITATCEGNGTCPNKTVTATITVNNGVYTGSAIETVYVTPGANWEGEITIEYQDNVNVGTEARAIIKVNGVEVTRVTFEIKKDPKTDEIDGEWVTINQAPNA